TVARGAGTGTLQGTLTATTVNGVVAFANLAHSVATNITLVFSSGALSSATSSSISIDPAAAHHLAIQTQPSATATAGVAFAQQPVIRLEDQFNNRVSSDNSSVVTAARHPDGDPLQGTTNVVTASGIVTFTNLACTVAT